MHLWAYALISVPSLKITRMSFLLRTVMQSTIASQSVSRNSVSGSRLLSSLTAEQRETLEKYDDCVNEMYGLIELEIFSYAFRLGGRLMLATLMDGAEDA